MKKFLAVAFVAALALAVGCGGGGTTGGTSGSVSGNSAAVSTAVTGASTQSSVSSTADCAAQTLDGDVVNQTRRSLMDYIALRAADEIRTQFPKGSAGKEVSAGFTCGQTSCTITATFTDEAVSEGNGTITLNGTLSFVGTLTAENEITLTASGNITADIANVTVTVTLDSVEYTETINGTMTLTFGGTFVAIFDDNYNITSLDSNLTVAITGSDVQATGTATGTADLALSVTMDGDAAEGEDGLTFTCDGTATATTDEGTETCNITSDCEGCE